MFILILYGFAELTTYLGLLFMLIGGIWLAKKRVLTYSGIIYNGRL